MLLIQSKTNLRDDNPVKNTCPLDSTSLTLYNPSISVSDSYSSCGNAHSVETVVILYNCALLNLLQPLVGQSIKEKSGTLDVTLNDMN